MSLTIPRATPRVQRGRRWQRLERELWRCCGAVGCGLLLAVITELGWRLA